jgi:hypothetical protein
MAAMLSCTALSEASSRFTFASLSPGVGYTLRARAVGLGEATRANLDLALPSTDYDVQFQA